MKKAFIILLVLLLGFIEVFSQAVGTSPASDSLANSLSTKSNLSYTSHYTPQRLDGASIYFRINQYDIDPDYMGNAAALQHLAHAIDSVGEEYVDSVVIRTQSSPDGSLKYNLRLTEQRAQSMRNYIDSNLSDFAHKIIVHADGESWAQLRECVKNDNSLKQESIDRILAIIDADVTVDTKKWRMKQLPEYRYLLDTHYSRIRNSTICTLYQSESRIYKTDTIVTETPKPIAVVEETIIPDTTTEVIPPIATSVEDIWTRHLYLKTNLAAWGLAISNIACEVDLAPHWSIALPIYYSAWNYGAPTLKFRTFAMLPEARYWLNSESEGLFVGAHAGFIYYNFAFNGDYRYQDHNGCSPAWGGGVNVGYRMALDAPKQWHIEFALGAGVYNLYYDTFHNVENGRLDNTYHGTYWGIDQVGITISYRFDLDKKGGKQ